MNPFCVVVTGAAVAYIVIVFLVARLIAGYGVSGSWIPVFDGLTSILLGVISLGFLNPAAVPVVGLGFTAAGFLRESRENKRIAVFVILAVGGALCAWTAVISLGRPIP